jgi:hypothetical protein
MSFSVQAEEVTKIDYQTEILDLLNQYGADFDDCFSELPSDFPSLPDNYTELDDAINEIKFNKWYHRKIPYMFIEIDEIFFAFKTDLSYFAIRISYLYIEEESEFIIYSVDFFETIEGVNSEFWNIQTLPNGVTEKSIKEIDICEANTPGFEFLILLAGTIAIVILRSKKKS